MNLSSRLQYLLAIIIVIFLGIISRKVSIIPLFIGDLLYATMSFFIFKFCFPKQINKKALVGAILYCFVIEFSQIIDIKEFNDLRNSPLGHLVLGNGFLIEDLVCYIFGAFLGFFIDEKFMKFS